MIPRIVAHVAAIAALFLYLCPADATGSDRVSLVTNRNDVSFLVKSGSVGFDFERVGPLADGQRSDQFVWQFDIARLKAILSKDFDLDPREIAFSSLCFGIRNERQITCRKLGTIKPGEKYYFTIVPKQGTATVLQTIQIIDSACVIIGNENQAKCQ